jgi:hypothetical protein
VAQPPERPLMIFDGDCEFCRYWIRRWQRSSGAEADSWSFKSSAAVFRKSRRARLKQPCN